MGGIVRAGETKERESIMNQATKDKTELVLPPATQPEPARPSARPRLSALGKVAFWASLVGTLAGIGGTVTLVLNGAADTTPIIIAAVCWLACLVLTITRLRWAPVVTSLISAYILYILFTQPFATASLANPKDAQLGGLGHFIGNVLLLACALLLFGASIASARENYRRNGSRKAPRWLPSGLALVAGLVIGAVFIGLIAQPAAPSSSAATSTAATSHSVSAPASASTSVPTVHMGTVNFDQSSITIPKGSKLMLVDDSSVPHILYNGQWQNGSPQKHQEPGAPTVNGVQVSGNSVTIGPFATAGTYHIYCAVHQGMNLTVIVQ
jgi:plastocyanin